MTAPVASPTTRRVRSRRPTGCVVGGLVSLLLAAAAIVAGLVAEGRLAQRVRPRTVEIVVHIDPPAADARAAERDVALPLEAVLRAGGGLQSVRTRSLAGMVVATCTSDGTTTAALLPHLLLATARGAVLPAGAVVTVGAAGPEGRPLRRLTLGARLAPAARHGLAREVRGAVRGVRGVGEVRVCGDARRIVRVVVDPVRVSALGLTLTALRAALALPRRSLTVTSTDAPDVGADPTGGMPPLDQLGQTVVVRGPTIVRLRDVAAVVDGLAPSPCTAWRHGAGDVAVLDAVAEVGGPRPDDDVATDVEAAVARVHAPPSSLWMMPVSRVHTSAALLLAPLGDPERMRETLRRVGDALAAAPDVREVILEIPREGRDVLHAAAGLVEPPVGAARVTVVGGASAPAIDATIETMPGVVYVPETVDRLVRVVGDDLDVDRDIAARARDLVVATPGIVGAVVLDAGDAPVVRFLPDSSRLERFGVTAADVSDTMMLARDGLELGVVRDGTESVDVVAVVPAQLTGPAALGDLRLVGTTGSVAPLSELGTIQLDEGPGQILRVDGHRVVEVGVWGAARAIDRAADAMRASLRLPPGVSLEVVEP